MVMILYLVHFCGCLAIESSKSELCVCNVSQLSKIGMERSIL